ncbi:MAG: pitrilysin family protein, partial [Bacteroidota bacterium]
MNGTTNRDRTNYFETLPSNQLETALWLEADRMGFLLDAVTQKKFEVQRSTVKNEKEQRQGVPYGMLGEITGQTLYPPNHPYSWPVIGYVDDLDRADVNDLKNFFMRWYGPNNAILSVAGDVKPEEVLKLAEKYFGPIPKGPEVRRQRVDRVALGSDKYETIEDRIFLPLTQMVFPTVPAYHRDEAALDLLADMLGDGNNSPFYKNFVKAEKANAAVVFHPTSQLAGEFTLIVQAFPNMKPSETEALIRSTIDEFETTGITDEALARVKAARVSQFVDIMESVGSKSSVLTAWHLAKGNLEYNLDREVKRYERVTKENILAVFNKYVKGKKAAIVTVVRKPYDPNDKESKPVSFNPYANAIVKDDPSYEGLSYTKPTDNFDRSKRPAVGPAKAPVVPEFYTANFDNGLKIIGTQSSETPKTTILIEMKGGHMLEGDDLPLGTANLTASMMAEGSEKYTAEEFSAKLDLLGASVSVNSGRETVTIFVDVPSKNVDPTMELLQDGLFNPKFAEEDFKRVKKQVLESVKNQKNSASYLANTAFNHLMYGNSILGSPTNGTEKTVEKIKLEHVKTYYDKYYSPKKANLVVVSSLPQAEIMAKLDWMKAWEAKDYQLPEVNAFPKYASTQIFLVDKPG